MSKKNSIRPKKIKEKTDLSVYDLIKKDKGDCFIIEKIDGKSYHLINIYNDEKQMVKKDDLVNQYSKVSFNYALRLALTTHSPLLDPSQPNYVLNRIVDDYALQICINIIHQTNPNEQVVDYPRVIVAANSDLSNVVVDHNGAWYKTSWNNNFLKHIHEKKHTLGEFFNNLYIGNCAEQHTVNNLITLNPDTDINKIIFSKAIRPRTGEIRDYCKNCCELFKQLKNK